MRHKPQANNFSTPSPFPYYPIFVNIQGKKCVVVGGGHVAFRKVRMLLDSGADVTVISPTLHPDLAPLVEKKAIHLIQRNYRPGDLKGAILVIAATDVKKTNRRVAEDAKKAGRLVNVVDDAGPSDFIIPSFFRRENLIIAVSTEGVSPALARKIRTKLEESIGEEYASLLALIGEVRSTLKDKGLKMDAEGWQQALDCDALIPLVKSGNLKKAKTILLKKLSVRKTR
jgi:precorrin-2 dehydrogenase / sirohydrochlorin ferrochelatase